MAAKAKERLVDLLGVAQVLHKHLTDALCQSVFVRVRRGERKRIWALEVLARFWVAVILRAPPSLTHALQEASGGGTNYPQTGGSDQGFFARCQTLSWEFFAGLFEAFQDSLTREEPEYFGGACQPLLDRFGRVFILDGSTLDQVARRLKVLWKDTRVVLPGSVVALYDLARGHPVKLHFERIPQGKEQLGARQVLQGLAPGALCVADALYGLPHFFRTLAAQGLFGLSRRNRRAKCTQERVLSRRKLAGGRVVESIVLLGGSHTPPERVRLILWRSGSRSLELVTNVLDPSRLSAKEAIGLYRARWSIERMFYDLKEVLNLHRFYAANVNAVAMQVYAAAIVYVALRTAQGRIAHEQSIAPERLSIPKLFPKVAAASTSLTTAELTFEAVCQANKRVELSKPDWRQMPFASAPLASVLVEKRSERRKKKRTRPSSHRRPLPRPPRRPD